MASIKCTFILAGFLINSFPIYELASKHPNKCENARMEKLYFTLTVANVTYKGALRDNEASRKFYNALPLEVSIKDLNGNEKYVPLSQRLPGTAEEISEIHKGDLMIWSGNTLVLFYKSFKTTYSYIPIARLEDPKDLEKVLGNADITIKFEKFSRSKG